LKRPGFLIVWPAHLDSSKTRGQGRRLPVSRAVKSPSAKEIWQAAMTLGYSPEITEKAALPHSSGEKTGSVTVRKTARRLEISRNIASEIVTIRQKATQALEPKKR
jgi:signal recognition particle subunit SRP19